MSEIPRIIRDRSIFESGKAIPYSLAQLEQFRLDFLHAHIAFGKRITAPSVEGNFGKWVYDNENQIGTLYIPLEAEGIAEISYIGALGSLRPLNAQVLEKNENGGIQILQTQYRENKILTAFYRPMDINISQISIVGNDDLWFNLEGLPKNPPRHTGRLWHGQDLLADRVLWLGCGWNVFLKAAQELIEVNFYMREGWVQNWKLIR